MAWTFKRFGFEEAEDMIIMIEKVAYNLKYGVPDS
jgi:hypothetical protein